VWLLRGAVVTVILGALVFNLQMTWSLWGDPVIDTGRELDVPRQLSEGWVLYRDVRYWYGPLAPYTNAALYSVFGERVGVLMAAGIAVATAVAGLVYGICRLFIGRAVSTAATVLFLTACAFGQYYTLNIFQFALPYSCAATYGVLVALASVFFLLRHAQRRRDRDLILACVFLALATLSKLEVLFAVGCAHALFLLGALRLGWLRRSVYLWAYLGAMAVPVAVYGTFLTLAGRGLVRNNLFLPGILGSSIVRRHSGLDDPVAGIRALLLSSLALGGILLLSTAAAWSVPRLSARMPPARQRLVPVGVGLAGAGAAAAVLLRFDISHVLRGVPLLMLVPLVVLGTRLLRGGDRAAAGLPAFVLFGFALAFLARIVLRCSAEHYGFYMLVPALPALAILLVRIPEVAGPRRSGAETTLIALGVLITLAGMHAARTAYATTTVYGSEAPRLVRGPRGALACPLRYQGSVDEAVRFLQDRPEGTTVVVIPEGVAITFLAGGTNPLGVQTFLPLDFSGAYDEAAMIERVREADPDYLVWTSRPLGEYGSRGLGVDYAQEFSRSLLGRFDLARTFASKQFTVAVYERRGRKREEGFLR
jgi:hypothetical protein